MRLRNIVYLCTLGMILSACGTKPIKPADQHLQQADTQAPSESSIPQSITESVVLPPPKPAIKVATYSVVVNNVSAQEILFALARDAKINLDIQSGIQGTVTVNAINQTLPQILTRIARQIDMRYELNNGTLTVMPDKPFLKTYKIDFINMSRSATSKNATSSQIEGGTSSGTGGGNTAETSVSSETKNNLMESVIKNITDIILEEDKLRWKSTSESAQSSKSAYSANVNASGDGGASSGMGGNTNYNFAPNSDKSKSGSNNKDSFTGNKNESLDAKSLKDDQSAGAAKLGVYEAAVSVFANKETGVLIARATSRQHEKIQEFVDHVMSAAKRQVLIEATIVEVKLSDQYQQGIDWSRALLGAKGFALSQTGTVGIAAATGALAISYINPTSKFGNIAASVQLLEKFGNVKVLSSPKLSVMNNQTASLKVADSKVYFTITSTTSAIGVTGTNGNIVFPITYTTTPHSVSVGLFMTVTPQISDSDTVTINIRPTITRINGYANDPNPSLLISNKIPEIQSREMESIIKIDSGQIAVMGGLIQEDIDKSTSEIPLLGRIPILGNLFQNRNDSTTKTELVIFLRPIVIKSASVDADFREFRNNLPDQDFFKESASGKP